MRPGGTGGDGEGTGVQRGPNGRQGPPERGTPLWIAAETLACSGGLRGFHGGSEDGGLLESEEFWTSRASSSRLRSIRVAMVTLALLMVCGLNSKGGAQ